MSLIKKLKNAFSGFTKAAALGTMLAASAYSQEPVVQPEIKLAFAPAERSVQFNFDSQFDTMESDLNFWHSANQSAGKLIDEIITMQENGSSKTGRALTVLLSYWISDGTNYYGHENAHVIPERVHGYDKGFEINWSRWDIVDWPEVVLGQIPKRITDKLSVEEQFQGLVAGLNYNEESSRMSWRRFWINDEKDLHNNNNFLVSKLRDEWYVFIIGMEDRRDNPKEPVIGDIDHNDVDQYVRELYKKDIHLTKPQYLLQTAVADLLSAHLWMSLKSPWEYVTNKNQNLMDYSFALGNIKVTPPLISHYLTDKGSFFDISAMINPSSKRPLELSLGFDVDFIGESELDRVRLGCQHHFLNLGNFSISPYASWDLTKRLESKGFSAGMSAEYDFTRDFGFFARAGYNLNDVIENSIDMKGNGAELSSGIKYKF